MQLDIFKTLILAACFFGISWAAEEDKVVEGCGCPSRTVCYGPRGPRGHRGAAGLRGPQGEQGQKGAPGTDGTFPTPQNVISMWTNTGSSAATYAPLDFESFTMTAGFTPSSSNSVTILEDGIYVAYVYMVTDRMTVKGQLDGADILGSESDFYPFAADQMYIQFVFNAQAGQVFQILYDGDIVTSQFVGLETTKASVTIQKVANIVI